MPEGLHRALVGRERAVHSQLELGRALPGHNVQVVLLDPLVSNKEPLPHHGLHGALKTLSRRL